MADFCRQCNKELFNMNESDFEIPSHLLNDMPMEATWAVLCEGCGPIIVDNDGNRVDSLKNEEEQK